jgi:ribosomal protein S25
MPNKNPKTVPLNIVGKSSDENIKRIEYIDEEVIIDIKKNIFFIRIFSSVNIYIKYDIEFK